MTLKQTTFDYPDNASLASGIAAPASGDQITLLGVLASGETRIVHTDATAPGGHYVTVSSPNPANGNVFGWDSVFSATGSQSLTMRGYIRLNADTSGDGASLAQSRTAASFGNSIRQDTGRKVSGTSRTGAAIGQYVVTLGTWYMVEQKQFPGTTTTDGRVIHRLYNLAGTLLASGDLVNTAAGAAALTSFRMGKTGAVGTVNADFAAFAVSDTMGADEWFGPLVPPAPPNTAPSSSISINPNVNIEPGQTVTITLGGADTDGTIVSRAVRQVSGTAVVLSGTGTTRTFIAPYTITGATLQFGQITTDDDGAVSSEVVASALVLPATERIKLANGTIVPLKRRIITADDPGVNPFNSSIKLFVDDQLSPVTNYVSETDPYTKSMLKRIADYPMPRWVGDWVGTPAQTQTFVRSYIDRAKAAAATPHIVVYAIPVRDLGSYSGGGDTSAVAYKQRIDSIAAGIASDRIIVILEPDALAQLDSLTTAQQAERLDCLLYAVNKFNALQSCSTYIDAGNADWKPAATMATRLVSAGIANARGFALNVSNFKTTSSNYNYGVAISDAVPNYNPPFIIDTSRNGYGPLMLGTDDERTFNPAGRALGERPQTAILGDRSDGNFWGKTVGESDGNRAGAPIAGAFYKSYAIMLAENAIWGATRTTASIKDDFATYNHSKWAYPAGTDVTLLSGRIQINAIPTYPTLFANGIYSLSESYFSVRVPQLPNVSNGTTHGTLQVEIDAQNKLQLFWQNGRVYFRDRVNNVVTETSIPYDPAIHGWWRIRENTDIVYWETSSDGNTWTVRRTKATPFSVDALKCSLQAGNNGNAPTPGTVQFDNVNTPEMIGGFTSLFTETF
jgi:endoglucanase